MYRTRPEFVGLVCCLVALASAARAGDRTETFRLKAGAASATRTGTIRGYDGVNYVFGAKSGQAMSIVFTGSEPSCYFNVYGPGGGEAVFNGSSSGNEFRTTLKASGSYRAQVYLMRNAARDNRACKYSITFEIAG